MPDLRLEMILIGLLLIGAVLLIISYIWVFIIQRSPFKLIMMVMRSALDRDKLVDPDAPIDIQQSMQASDTLKQQGHAFKESAMFPNAQVTAQSVGAPPPHYVPKAPLNETDVHIADETTSDNGWPVRMDKATRQSRRPFLHIQLDSDKDTTSDQQP